MKKQRQEVRNSAKLKWLSGMDEKVAVIKIRSWNPQFLLELKNSFFLGSKNDKTMLTRKQITLRGNEMARQSKEDHWHFLFCIRYDNWARGLDGKWLSRKWMSRIDSGCSFFAKSQWQSKNPANQNRRRQKRRESVSLASIPLKNQDIVQHQTRRCPAIGEAKDWDRDMINM